MSGTEQQLAIQDSAIPEDIPQERGIQVLQIRECGTDFSVWFEFADGRGNLRADGCEIFSIENEQHVNIRSPIDIPPRERPEEDHGLEAR